MKDLKAIPISPASPVDTASIPNYVAQNIAQVAHKSILQAWNDPVIQAEYQQWKAERAATQEKKG